MEALWLFYGYVGPALWLLLPMSILAWGLIFNVFHSIWFNKEINDWTEVQLAHIKETATVVGILGSVYALTKSFGVEGASPEQIRLQMFSILSTGFWSTIIGGLVSIEASIGLLAMKRM